MDTWTMVFLAWAGVTIAVHTLVLMCYVMTCYRVWKRVDGPEGFLRIAGRAALGTVVYGLIAIVVWGLLLVFGALLAMGPEAAEKLSLPAGLAFKTAAATFLLPMQATSWNWSLISALVLLLTGFFLLGLGTMLPGLGYGSKVLWGAVGLAGYAVYLFISIAGDQDTYGWAAVLIAAGISLPVVVIWLCLRIWAVLRAGTRLPEGIETVSG